MNTLTAAAHREQDPGLQPLPWRRMVWVTWRLHRLALISMTGLLGAMAVGMWIVGSQLHTAYTAASASHLQGRLRAVAQLASSLE